MYHLNEPNPWDGPFKGHSTHIFDVALLFKNFDHELDDPARTVGQAFGDNIIKFINNEKPWQATTAERPVALVYGGQAGPGELVEDKPENVGRRETIFEFRTTIGFDTLHEAFTAFLGGR